MSRNKRRTPGVPLSLQATQSTTTTVNEVSTKMNTQATAGTQDEARENIAPTSDAANTEPTESTTTQDTPVPPEAPTVAEHTPTPAPVVPASVVKQPVQPVPVVVPNVVPQQFAGADLPYSLAMDVFDRYIENMRPGLRVANDQGANHQRSLFFALKNILDNGTDESFPKAWNEVLRYFREHEEGVFAWTHSHRFLEYAAMSKQELALYERLLTLCSLTAHPHERKTALKQFTFAKLVNDGITDKGYTRLANFYNV